jgi:hypothetical protein
MPQGLKSQEQSRASSRLCVRRSTAERCMRGELHADCFPILALKRSLTMQGLLPQVAHPLLVKPLAFSRLHPPTEPLCSTGMALSSPALEVLSRGAPATLAQTLLTPRQSEQGGFRAEALPVHALSTTATRAAWLAATDGQPLHEHGISTLRHKAAELLLPTGSGPATTPSSTGNQPQAQFHPNKGPSQKIPTRPSDCSMSKNHSHAPVELMVLARSCCLPDSETGDGGAGIERRAVVLTPRRWAHVLLSLLVHAGAVPVGQDEERRMNAARLRPTFPYDFPHLEAYWCVSHRC